MLRDNHGDLTVEITRSQIEAWAGRALTDAELERLDEAIPHSSIPEAVGAIVDGMELDDDEAGCEGHYDDDAAVLGGGIGEPYYCDGTCR